MQHYYSGPEDYNRQNNYCLVWHNDQGELSILSQYPTRKAAERHEKAWCWVMTLREFRKTYSEEEAQGLPAQRRKDRADEHWVRANPEAAEQQYRETFTRVKARLNALIEPANSDMLLPTIPPR